MAFLWYNKPRARIYLGDTGSLFIGGFLAAIPFLFPWSALHPHGFITPALVLWIPLFEVVSLIVIRTRKGIPFYKGSPDHFCHYLQRWGWSVPAILFLAAAISQIALGATLLFLWGTVPLWLLIVVALAGFATWLQQVLKIQDVR